MKFKAPGAVALLVGGLLLLLAAPPVHCSPKEEQQQQQQPWGVYLNDLIGIDWISVGENVVTASQFLQSKVEWMRATYAKGSLITFLTEGGLLEPAIEEEEPSERPTITNPTFTETAPKAPVLPPLSGRIERAGVGKRALPGDSYCNNGGVVVGGGSTCTCFHGNSGPKCEETQPYRCQFRLLSPNLACAKDPEEILDPEYHSSDSCHKYSITGKVTLEYKLACSFSNSTFNFTTFVLENSFPQGEVEAFVHGVNFCRLTDFSKGDRQIVTTDHFLGKQNLTFNFDLETFTSVPRFVSGGRLYIETRFVEDKKPKGLQNNPTDSQFVDFNDWKFTTTKEPMSPGDIAGIVLGTLLGIMLLAGIGFYIYKRNKPVPS